MRVIDAWVNVGMTDTPTAWQKQVAEEVFKRPKEDVFKAFSVEEVVGAMDEAGVEKAILTLRVDRPSKEVLKFVEARPERFAVSALVDPRTGVKATRELEALVRQHPVKLARVIPCVVGLPPDDRAYYPLYAKCVELGLPVSVNTGVPGPLLPARTQDPIALDDVCLFFPELVVVMANGADPWWDVAIRLMVQHKHLYLMTSAFAPKYLPPSLLQFMSSRGQDKVMFATDFPFLTMQRCTTEARALGLPEDVLAKYLYDNADRVLFKSAATAST
jgi:predicted TIM-barrel fold metal-dependent hydrolase